MRLIYEATDGAQFETEEECSQYEFKLNYADILPFFTNEDIRVWGNRCERKNLEECLEKYDLESFFDRAFYIDFKTEKSRLALEKFADEHNIYLGSCYTYPFKSADFYYWDSKEECWCSLSALKGLVATMEEVRNSPSN